MFSLGKMSLIITTRCNLRCKLCCEYIPQHRPFPDMTLDEELRILAAVFGVCDHIGTLHLTGGGEPFLHRQLAEMIEIAMQYSGKFDKLMLFTNCTVPLTQEISDTLNRYKEKLFLQLSRYGIKPDAEEKFVQTIVDAGIPNRIRKYYGDDQSFGGWVYFGDWNKQNIPADELAERFAKCACTKVFHGNWRTRDGKVHWCSRSQRGMELGLLPDNAADYIDLFDGTSVEEKRYKFENIAGKSYITACGYCSGDQGTDDFQKRFKAGEQIV